MGKQRKKTGLVIRSVNKADIGPCHRIEASCYDPVEAASRQKIAKRIQDYPEGFLVADLNGKVVGLINSGAADVVCLADEEFKDMIKHDPMGRHAVIFSVAVHKSQQGRGIAGLLLGQFIERMRDMDKESIYLICKRDLIVFYEKFGFIHIGRSDSAHGGATWHEMVRVLGE